MNRQKSPPIPFCQTWQPGFVPSLRRIGKRAISGRTDQAGNVQRTIQFPHRLLPLVLLRGTGRIAERLVDLPQTPQHPKVVPVKMSDRKKNFQIVAIQCNPLQIPVQQPQQLIVLCQKFSS